MFKKLVSQLSITPQANSGLTFYARRLGQEKITRRLSAIFAVLLIGLQVATIVAPSQASNAASCNDIVFGGVTSVAQILNIYDHGVGGCVNQSAAQVQAMYTALGITRNDLTNMHVVPISSKDHYLLSLGRIHYFAQDQLIQAGGENYYLRPLYLWDTGANVANGSTYAAFVGTRAVDGQLFWIMEACGNVVVHSLPAAPAPPPPPPAPVATPVPTPIPTPLPTPIPKPPAHITQTKSALNLTQLTNGQPTDATTVTAQPGDTIKYTLITSNDGGTAQENYVVSDQIADIEDYATVTDLGGATLDTSTGTLNWPEATVPAGGSLTDTFTVQVKNPVPVTPTGVSDPESFDLKMTNVYGNQLVVNVAPPLPKQIEMASASLPQTGAGSNAVIVLSFLAFVVYFWARNRQLLREVKVLRQDYQGGGS